MLLVVGVPRSAITDTSAQILLRIHLVMLFFPPFAVLHCECLFALGEGLTELGGALAVFVLIFSTVRLVFREPTKSQKNACR